MFNKKSLLQKHFKPEPHLNQALTTTTLVSREHQLVAIKKLFDTHGIPLFIVFGTCLSATRDGKLIDHDNSIELAFYNEDIKRINVLVPSINQLGIYIESICETNITMHIKGCKTTFNFWNISTVKNPIHRLRGYTWAYNLNLFKEDYFNKDKICTQTLLKYPFRVPYLVETYLEEHYGASWRKPTQGYKVNYRSKLPQFIKTLLTVLTTIKKRFKF